VGLAVADDASPSGGKCGVLALGETRIRQRHGERWPPHSLYRVRQHIGSGSPLEPIIGSSRAVRDEHLVFVSATAAIRPDGHVDPDAGVQARRCLEIIDEALRESGAVRDVVRTRVFLSMLPTVTLSQKVHGEILGAIRPASGFIVVRGFLDPRWLVEIEADAVVGG
jgi:enamine deaminase RidA (YjgF/YER057c/UK114 family)